MNGLAPTSGAEAIDRIHSGEEFEEYGHFKAWVTFILQVRNASVIYFLAVDLRRRIDGAHVRISSRR